MISTLSSLLAVLLLFTVTSAQKVSTILGDAWTGEVVSTNDGTREITIKYLQKGNTETFTATLNEGYRVTLKDGSSHELNVSEILIGTRVRLFSRTKEQNVGRAKQHVIDGLLITTGEGAQCFRQDEGDEEAGDGQEELLLLVA